MGLPSTCAVIAIRLPFTQLAKTTGRATGNFGGSFAGATLETKATFVYGVGPQYAFTRHFSLRAEYRGLVYKAPSFNLAGLNTDSSTQIAQPSAGIVFRF
jgi:opacity protein-like surface antigen